MGFIYCQCGKFKPKDGQTCKRCKLRTDEFDKVEKLYKQSLFILINTIPLFVALFYLVIRGAIYGDLAPYGKMALPLAISLFLFTGWYSVKSFNRYREVKRIYSIIFKKTYASHEEE